MKIAKTRSRLGTNSVFNKKPPEAEPVKNDEKTDPAVRKLLAFRVSRAVYTQLRISAAELNTTQQEVFEEALNDWFKKKGKPPIA